ncbi:succinate dehydrogenase assembly factor 2 [Pararhodospirillum oryzae]|uniref:FAD assembly factor SdhE n=1 Tax=Pararhodospirillum oryzae TaxID=478448 RepID=A0A512HBV0_9PROT|nr:succinate dehydrogenase assembly factor 2 [Pararhodospirillum oryzae]GEO82921.1 succinate dehydrogenase assembly factor 2 [Pararhodospirillum oryzae]
MTDETPLDLRRKRLIYRSSYRGSKEADLFLGAFARARVPTMPDDQLDRFEALLEEHDPDIMDWILERQPMPEVYRNDVMALLQAFRLTP